jgi:hypothetical protein
MKFFLSGMVALLLLFGVFGAGAFAQEAEDAAPEEEAASAGETAPLEGPAAGEVQVSEEPVQPEAVQPVATAAPPIELKDSLLSVNLKDATVGTVINEIGRKAGFKPNINPSVSNKLVSTSFKDLKLEKGIGRILSLAGAGNFMIKTDSAGKITSLRVFEEPATVRATTAPGAQPPRVSAPATRAPSRQPVRPFFRGARRPVTPTPPAAPQAPSEEELHPELFEEPAEGEEEPQEDEGFPQP